jgi:hypothetical protein
MSEATFHEQHPNPVVTEELLDEAYRVNGAYDFLEEHKVRGMANETIEAHGRRMSVAEGIAECPPFAQAVRGTVEGLREMGVEDSEKIQKFVRKTLDVKVNEAPTTVTTEAEKK